MWKSLAPVVLTVPLLVGWLQLDPFEPRGRPELQGIWDRVEPAGGPPVQFYYFHTDDSGLYRFGTTALNHTEMFNTRWRKDGLELVFRKTKERRFSPVRVTTDDDGRRILIVARDPRNDDKETRYRRRTSGGPRSSIGALNQDPFARMWMHRRDLGKGRLDFRIYQFQPAGQDGHGTGWYHHGDFDEWTTEALGFHRGPRGMHLHFAARDEWAFSEFAVREDRGTRRLRLERDPRYFGRPSVYQDAGPTLMTSESPLVLVLAVSTDTP